MRRHQADLGKNRDPGRPAQAGGLDCRAAIKEPCLSSRIHHSTRKKVKVFRVDPVTLQMIYRLGGSDASPKGGDVPTRQRSLSRSTGVGALGMQETSKKNKADVLEKKFQEAMKRAKDAPDSPRVRDIDLD